ncbi:MAG TPA: GNAT family protein, partial [Terriglobales bacterium]|nr:GNAT family protein [Terriglobales bacterium]
CVSGSRVSDYIASTQAISQTIASGRILRKLGMTHEGTTREHVRKWGEYLDVEIYGLLARECAKAELE